MKKYIHKFTYTLILLVCLFSFKAYSQACSFTINNNPKITINQFGSTQNFGITTSCNLNDISFSSNESWAHASISSGGSLQISCDQNTSYDQSANVNILYNQQSISGFTVYQEGSGPEPTDPCVINGFQSTTFNSTGQSITFQLTASNCGGGSWNPFVLTKTDGSALPSWIAPYISQTGNTITIDLPLNDSGINQHEVVKGKTKINGQDVEIYGDMVQATCLKTWYKDTDGDGFAASTLTQCNNPGTGYTQTVMTLGDCEDYNASINPNTVWYLDADNDGFAISTLTQCASPGNGYSTTIKPLTDCNDFNVNINPNTIWYQDADGDGFGNPLVSTIQCNQPNSYVLNNTDQCPTINSPSSDCSGYSNENYVFTRLYQRAMNNSSEITNSSDAIEKITYYDGIGRPKQSIAIRAGGDSANSEDIITPIVYDDYGRQKQEYLPFASASQGGGIFNDPVNAVESFYNTPKYENTTNPYSEKQLEESPLNRVLKEAAPGEDWKLGNDHEIEFNYGTNITNEVRFFKATLATGYIPSLVIDGHYTAGELYKTVTKDENHTGNTKNHTTEEFKDKEGRVVLKRTYNADVAHDTYYVYDKFGNLTYVIPPKVTADNVSSIELDELCYQYKYDSRNRLVEKKIPGKDWEFIIYNKLDQPILTQDANLRGTGTSRKWLFTKYDAFGRVAYTGLYTYTDGNTDSWQRLSDLQDDVNSETIQFEDRSNSTVDGETINWGNAAFPQTSITELHTVNYYDNYVLIPSGLTVPTGIIYDQTIATGVKIKGLPTVSKIRVLGTTDWITTITVYDIKGRAIYIASKNEYLETTDIVQTKYDFTGKVLKTRSRHQKDNDNEIVTLDTFEYDHMGRLLNQIQCIGDDSLPDDCSGVGNVANLVLTSPITTSKTEVASTSIVMDTGFIVDATVNSSLSFTASIEQGGEQIVANHYDELGQLDYKNVGGKPSPSGGGATGGGGLQTVDYTYNIRGWLKEINEGTTSNGDLFGFKINYNTPDYSPNTRGLFNGNISETHWITANDSKNRNYRYEYDALNRITDAINIGENEGHRYRVINIKYDKNGNLLGLHRNGWKNEAVSYGNIDVLEYTYDSGNKLTKVKDYGSGDYGFKDGTNTGNDYVYDANGNLTSDANKQITSILYNHLNLPTEVKFNNLNTRKINYIYGADGTKLQKLVNENGNETATEYAGNYIYENDVLQFFNTAEGYVTPDSNGGYDYVYQYKDHLGNIRLSYSDADGNGTINPNTEIVKESNYYPFGLTHKGYNGGVSSLGNSVAKRFMFGGKELSEELDLNTYDFGARNYNPALGRWFVIDPKADDILQVDITPYNYSWNNPTNISDPDGKCPWCWGAAIGALVETGSQIAVNMISGDQSFLEAVGNIDYERVAIATVTGAATGGLSTIKVIGSVAKVYKAVAISSTAAGGNIVTQNMDGNKTVDPVQMGMDALLESLPTPKVKAPEVPSVPKNTVKKVERQLDRAERVAGENPRPSRAEAVKESKKEVKKVENQQKKIDNANKALKNVPNTVDAAAKEAANTGLQKAIDNSNFQNKM